MSNKLETGFEKGDSRNLPRVDMFMVYEFISADDRFNAPEVRGAKANASSRETYGDTAIGYVCLKREQNTCILKAKICPEHKVRNKSYSVEAIIDEQKNIIHDVNCLDCPAAEDIFSEKTYNEDNEKSFINTEMSKYVKSTNVDSNIKQQYSKKMHDTNESMFDQSSQNIPANRKSKIHKFFNTFPLIPCRSKVLQEHFPTLSNATKILPEFFLIDNCKHCKKKKKVQKHKFKYKKRYILAEGSHLTIPCPEAATDSNVVWRKDSLLLEKGKGHSFRKKDAEPRVLVDTFYSIYLKDVSKDEQGNYTCFVDKSSMLQVKIMVVSKNGLLTAAFVRHLGYLGFFFFITLFCYCTGVVQSCRNPEKFKTYEQVEEHERLLR